MIAEMVFILGADDPEMREIEAILKWDRRICLYAMKDGKRVHPGNAYSAERPLLEELTYNGPYRLVLVECQPEGIPEGTEIIRIDHHRPGDPGYGLPPAQFWQASSLGQLVNFLGLEMELGSHDQLILAAMDHAPATAIRGECPGVTAKEIIDRKVSEIAKATGISEGDVRACIAQWAVRLGSAPVIDIGGQGIRDMRPSDRGSGYSLNYLCLQVAALVGGYGVLLLTHDGGDAREKWTIAGHCTPQCVETFMVEWAPAQGLTGIYGVPNRGYAGGYLPQSRKSDV